MRSVLIKFVAASVGGERFRFGARILSAIQRTNSINDAVRLAIRGSFQERTNIGQFAAGAAMQAPAFAVFGNRQNRSKSPFDFVEHNTRTKNPLSFSKNSDDIFDLYDKKAVIAFKVDGNSTFRIEEDFVIFSQG